MLSLSGQTAAAPSEDNSVCVGASVKICPCSIQSTAPAIEATIIARSSFETKFGFPNWRDTVGRASVLRMEPPLPEIPSQIGDRQDRDQPHQGQRNLPGHAFGK